MQRMHFLIFRVIYNEGTTVYTHMTLLLPTTAFQCIKCLLLLISITSLEIIFVGGGGYTDKQNLIVQLTKQVHLSLTVMLNRQDFKSWHLHFVTEFQNR